MKILLTGFVALCVLGVAVFFLNPFTNKKTALLDKNEKKHAIETILGRQAVLNSKKADDYVRHSGKYIHVSYPESAILADEKVPKDPVLETFAFAYGSPKVNVSLQAAKTDVSSLSDVSGVALREEKKNVYQADTIHIEGVSGLSFKKTDEAPLEYVGFLLRNGIIYTIGVIGYSDTDITSAFTKTLSSFSFTD